MSHHLDSPLARKDPRLNITDQFVFDADGSTVLVMCVRTSLAGDTHRDALHPDARYEVKVHLDGDAHEDLTYRFAFSPTEDGRQPYTVERLLGPDARDDAATGTVVARGSTGTATGTDEGGQVWVGEAKDPFFLDLSELGGVTAVVLHGGREDLTRWVRGAAQDSFSTGTVQALVLTLPLGAGGLSDGRQVAVWSTTRLRTDAGGWQQVGRTGLPMVWPLFRDQDLDSSSEANRTHPADDVRLYRSGISGLVASVVQRRSTSERPADYADALAARLVPDLLPYQVGTPALFGFTAFNGRRLSDNAPEVMFSLATNSAVPTGLRAADLARSQEDFPFVLPA